MKKCKLQKCIIINFYIKIGFEAAFGIPRLAMRLQGIWPNSKSWISKYFYIIPALAMIIFINIPQTVQVLIDKNDLNAVLDILTLANVPIGVAVIKGLTINMNRNGN